MISAVEQLPDGLQIELQSGVAAFVSWQWLRDHGEDAASMDPETLQRSVDTFALPEDLVAGGHEIVDGGSAVRVSWPDGIADTVCSAALLESVFSPGASPLDLWATGAGGAGHPTFVWDELAEDDAVLVRCLGELTSHGFAVIQNIPASEEGAAALAGRISAPRHTVFGTIWRLASEMTDHRDSAYSTTFLEPHTDATYMTDAPGTQLFCCAERTGIGGESILVDGFAIAEDLRAQDPAAFDVLSKVVVTGRYVEPEVHLRAQRPALRLGPDGELLQLSFNNYDRAPFWLPAEEMASFYRAYKALHELIMERERWYELRLEPGDGLIFDNWRVLHGRQGYTGRRVFHGCYHNRDDILSRIHTLSPVL